MRHGVCPPLDPALISTFLRLVSAHELDSSEGSDICNFVVALSCCQNPSGNPGVVVHNCAWRLRQEDQEFQEAT
jgi:hypothetical protein